jgi:hypothetical protein
MLGKVTNVWMTDANGNILTGNNIVNGYSRGFAYFADGSPLVGQYGGFPTTTSSYGSSNWSSQNTTKQVALMEARYNTDGTIKDIRYNAWTSGTPGSGLEGQYAYRVDKFDSQGQRTTKWLNDPAPTHYEPTFSGTILKSDTGQYYMKVTSAFNDSGQDITSSYANKVYLLTTRFSTNPSDASGGQPNYDTSQNIASATGGGASRFTQGTNLTGQNAAAFAQAGWDGIVGSTVTVQGHLMTNPSASQKGLYYGGQSIGVFSAFDLR